MDLENPDPPMVNESPEMMGHCPAHGLNFPPDSTCPLCQHGLSAGFSGRSNRKKRSGGILFGILILMGMAAIPNQWLEKGLRVMLPFASTHQMEETLGIDPNRYQGEISSLESILYQSGSAQYFEGQRIQIFTDQLANSIRAQEDKLPARIARERLTFFGARVWSPEDDAQKRIDLSVVQEDWEKVRGKIFADAEWFQPNPTLSGPATTEPEPAATELEPISPKTTPPPPTEPSPTS